MSALQSTRSERLAGLPLIRQLLALKPVFGRALVLGLAALVALVLTVSPGAQTQLLVIEERLGALGWTLAPETELETRIVVVSIDEKSLAEVGPWPWPRETMADLTRLIDGAGAQLQLHDILYADARDGDQQLVAALAGARGAVVAQVPVLAVNQAADLAPETIRAGSLGGALGGIDCAEQPRLMSSLSYLAPHAGFSSVPKGHIAPVVNADGSISRQPAAVCVDGQAYPSLALAGLIEATGSGINEAANPTSRSNATLRLDTSFMGPAQRLSFDAYPGLAVPLDADGTMRISYSRAPGSYLAVPAVDVLNGTADPALFDNAWVLVGATAFGMGDVVPTPYSGATPGVELQARILGSLLDVAVPYTPRNAVMLLAVIAAIFAAVLLRASALMSGRFTALLLPSAAVLLPLVSLLIHAQLLRSASIWLGWVLPAIFALVGATLLFVLEQARMRSQRDRVYSNLASYLPGEIAKEIAFSLPNSSVNAKRENVTLLSADLRNFSAFGEMRSPEETAAVLHFFFQKATQIVEAHGGNLHEYKGDSILALWNAQDAQSAAQALAAAKQMVIEIDAISLQANTPYGLEQLALGVSIEQGPALVGSIGPAHRRTHTLLGDTVTVTLRIQEMTAELAQPILIGECAARQLDMSALQSQGSYLLEGLTIPHVLFAPQPEQAELESLSDSLQAREADAGTQPKLRVLSGGRS